MKTDDRQAPPPRCPKHLDQPTEEACRGCGQAREKRALWEALERAEDDDQEDA